MTSPTHDTVLTKSYLSFSTLPIMDGAIWSKKNVHAGIWPVLLVPGEKDIPLPVEGPPVITELTPAELSITQPLRGGGMFSILCRETGIEFAGTDEKKQPLPWAVDLIGGAGQKSTVTKVTENRIAYRYNGTDYPLKLAPDAGTCEQLDTSAIQLKPNRSGKVIMAFGRRQIKTR